MLTGTLADPYSGRTIAFQRGQDTSEDVQIDHVVALSDAWQKGAQGFSATQRTAFANDPLNLPAVDGPLNQQKGDGDAATWLPPKGAIGVPTSPGRVAVKVSYDLWMTQAEKNASDICAKRHGLTDGSAGSAAPARAVDPRAAALTC